MKKLIIVILPIIHALILGMQFSPSQQTVEKPVNKSINLSVYRDNNYTSQAYDSTIASVHITITKVQGDKLTTVCDKTLGAMPLKQFPAAQNALSSNLSFPALANTTEKLVINYTITYNTRGSILTFYKNVITSAAQKKDLSIAI